jgi:hypothetical protein
MPQHSSESNALDDVIDHFVSTEGRQREEVAKEMEGLASLYRNVMRYPLPEISTRFTTKDRVEALRTMRHSLPNDESFDDEQPARRDFIAAA